MVLIELGLLLELLDFLGDLAALAVVTRPCRRRFQNPHRPPRPRRPTAATPGRCGAPSGGGRPDRCQTRAPRAPAAGAGSPASGCAAALPPCRARDNLNLNQRSITSRSSPPKYQLLKNSTTNKILASNNSLAYNATIPRTGHIQWRSTRMKNNLYTQIKRLICSRVLCVSKLYFMGWQVIFFDVRLRSGVGKFFFLNLLTRFFLV